MDNALSFTYFVIVLTFKFHIFRYDFDMSTDSVTYGLIYYFQKDVKS